MSADEGTIQDNNSGQSSLSEHYRKSKNQRRDTKKRKGWEQSQLQQ